MRLIILFVRIYRRADHRVRTVLARFMLCLQSLDFRLRIAAGLLEILGGIVQFILIQIGLRLGDVDLVLQIFFLRFRRGRQLLGQLRDIVLIFLDGLLSLDLARGNLLGFRRERRRILLRRAQRIEESEIDFVIPDFFASCASACSSGVPAIAPMRCAVCSGRWSTSGCVARRCFASENRLDRRRRGRTVFGAGGSSRASTSCRRRPPPSAAAIRFR